MAESIEVSAVLPASPRRVYEAWLSGAEHGAMTGGAAACDPLVGGRHTAWDGYIQGVNLRLEPYQRVVQTWRTTDFPEGSPDSQLEMLLEEVQGGARIILVHTDIPDGQGKDYRQGWIDHYFEPMKEYFSSTTGG